MAKFITQFRKFITQFMFAYKFKFQVKSYTFTTSIKKEKVPDMMLSLFFIGVCVTFIFSPANGTHKSDIQDLHMKMDMMMKYAGKHLFTSSQRNINKTC